MFDTTVSAWQHHLAEAQASPHLVAPFSHVLEAFFAHLAQHGVRHLANLSPELVAQWRDQLVHRAWRPKHPNFWHGTLCPVTPPWHAVLSPAERFFAVRCFLRWLWRTGDLAADPAAELRPLPLPSRPPNWGLTPAMAEALLLSPDLATDHVLRSRRSLAWRDQAVLHVLYRHGLSPQALLRLTLAAVSMGRGDRPDGRAPRGDLVLAEDPPPGLATWCQHGRPTLLRQPTQALFLNPDGTPLNAAGLKALVAEAALQAGVSRRVSARILSVAGYPNSVGCGTLVIMNGQGKSGV